MLDRLSGDNTWIRSGAAKPGGREPREDARWQGRWLALIAQPFNDDRFFKSRPSPTSPAYNATASGPSNLAANNYALRDRVAQQLGPIVKYAGPLDKRGKPVGPDVEAWFRKDMLGGKPGIVAQWANMHNGPPQNWVKSDMTPSGDYGACGQFVKNWQKTHKADVDAWIKDNPNTPDPKPEDLVAPFFASFSKDHPGKFPSLVEHKLPDGKTKKVIELVKEGTDIQSNFFDLWLSENPDADLEKVPADFVTTSGSGLDPHITLDNANWQLANQPIAAAWAKVVAGEKASDEEKAKVEEKIRKEIGQLLQQKSFAPLGGLAGVPLVNVLEINLGLQEKYEK